MYVYERGHADVMVHSWSSEDNFQELVLFHYMGPGIKLVSLGLEASVFTSWAISPGSKFACYLCSTLSFNE